MKTTLVIMAAGIGSRFGGGIKQLEAVGPHGEIIMDYSIYDALEAGFNKVVFIIRKELEKDFKEIIGNRIEAICEVAYAFQELEQLPDGFTAPSQRTKPWGTGQAVLSCKEIVKEPFVVINADDYYGKEAFVKVHNFLVQEHPIQGKLDFCMAGFILKNTLSDNGVVTRGICHVGQDSRLVDIVETHGIEKTAKGAVVKIGEELVTIDVENHVSMNMWGLTTEFFAILEEGFITFLSEQAPDDYKSEYLLPTIIDQLIKNNQAQVTVLETKDQWFGVTYKEDKQVVVDSFAQLIQEGVYQEKLF
ncbi:MAG: sugar phosphate nucleotidyltransferase [Lachnospiraceae bacterium]